MFAACQGVGSAVVVIMQRPVLLGQVVQYYSGTRTSCCIIVGDTSVLQVLCRTTCILCMPCSKWTQALLQQPAVTAVWLRCVAAHWQCMYVRPCCFVVHKGQQLAA
jgi:hypothetical protein